MSCSGVNVQSPASTRQAVRSPLRAQGAPVPSSSPRHSAGRRLNWHDKERHGDQNGAGCSWSSPCKQIAWLPSEIHHGELAKTLGGHDVGSKRSVACGSFEGEWASHDIGVPLTFSAQKQQVASRCQNW